MVMDFNNSQSEVPVGSTHTTFALVLLRVLVFCQFCGMQSADLHADQPNIVFIFADDQSAKTIGAYGNEHIQTPNLDRLAREGVNFSRAYNMGAWNGAVCVASRAMLNTGLSVWKAYAMDKVLRQGKATENMWSKLMEQQGYRTYMTGKWHVSADANEVFQQVRHIRPGMPGDGWNSESVKPLSAALKAGVRGPALQEVMPVGYGRPLGKDDQSWSPTDPKFGGFYAGGKHWSEVLKDDALAFIDDAKEHDEPFFMYLAFNAPHDPRQAPQEYQDMYDAESLPLPESWLPLYPEMEEIDNGPGLRDAALVPFPRTEYATHVHLKEYYAIISHLDTQIGEILKALEATGKMDNTYIIYTADHGLAVGEHGLFGKQNMYEHSVRVPFIVKGPDLEAGRTVEADIYLQDTMATALELAGAEKPGHVFFHSVLPLARGETSESAYDAVYGGYVKSQRMIKKDGSKLIVYPKANKIKLFDLKADPEELHNLADDPANAEKVRNLFHELVTLQDSLGDELDLRPMLEEL